MCNRLFVSLLLIQVFCAVSFASSHNWTLLNSANSTSQHHRMSLLRVNATASDSTSQADSSKANLPSPKSAEQRSLLYTLVPLPTLILTVPGLLAGPSAGYFYAGMNGRAWSGIGIRTLALGGMFSAFGICGWDCGPGESAYTIAWAVFIGSGALLAGSAIYDIATVKSATARNNEQRRQVVVTLYPGYFPKLEAFGVIMSHRF